MNHPSPSLSEIADGAPFDATLAIRKLCQTMVDQRPSFDTEIKVLPDLPVPDLDALPQRLVQLLAYHGYHSPAEIAAAPDVDLLAIDGIAAKTLVLIRQNIRV